jgi:hypothetical protein
MQADETQQDPKKATSYNLSVYFCIGDENAAHRVPLVDSMDLGDENAAHRVPLVDSMDRPKIVIIPFNI